MGDIRTHGFHLTANSVITVSALMGIFWAFGAPWLEGEMSVALADDITQAIDLRAQPMEKAFKVLLLSDINQIKKDIAMLEYREEHESSTWTPEHASLLADKKAALRAIEEAYKEL